jgi:hypothetical protein
MSHRFHPDNSTPPTAGNSPSSTARSSGCATGRAMSRPMTAPPMTPIGSCSSTNPVTGSSRSTRSKSLARPTWPADEVPKQMHHDFRVSSVAGLRNSAAERRGSAQSCSTTGQSKRTSRSTCSPTQEAARSASSCPPANRHHDVYRPGRRQWTFRHIIGCANVHYLRGRARHLCLLRNNSKSARAFGGNARRWIVTRTPGLLTIHPLAQTGRWPRQPFLENG